jgi:hypothetical protein
MEDGYRPPLCKSAPGFPEFASDPVNQKGPFDWGLYFRYGFKTWFFFLSLQVFIQGGVFSALAHQSVPGLARADPGI